MVAPALRDAQESSRSPCTTGVTLTLSVLLQNVEDNLSAINHLQTQADIFQQVCQRNPQLFGSQGSVALIQSLGGGWQETRQ